MALFLVLSSAQQFGDGPRTTGCPNLAIAAGVGADYSEPVYWKTLSCCSALRNPARISEEEAQSVCLRI